MEHNDSFNEKLINKTEEYSEYKGLISNINLCDANKQGDSNINETEIKDTKRIESISSINSSTTSDSQTALNAHELKPEHNNINSFPFGSNDENFNLIYSKNELTKILNDNDDELNEHNNIEQDNQTELNENKYTRQNDNHEIIINGDINNMSFCCNDKNDNKTKINYINDDDININNNIINNHVINNNKTNSYDYEMKNDKLHNNIIKKIKVLSLPEIILLDNIADKLEAVFHAIRSNKKLQHKYNANLCKKYKVKELKYSAQEIAEYFIHNILLEKVCIGKTSIYKQQYIRNPKALQYNKGLIDCCNNT